MASRYVSNHKKNPLLADQFIPHEERVSAVDGDYEYSRIIMSTCEILHTSRSERTANETSLSIEAQTTRGETRSNRNIPLYFRTIHAARQHHDPSDILELTLQNEEPKKRYVTNDITNPPPPLVNGPAGSVLHDHLLISVLR